MAFVAVLNTGYIIFRLSHTDNPTAEQKFREFISSSKSPITYSLGNPTEEQKLQRLTSITLYKDGTASLPTPIIISYTLPLCTYSIEEGELLIYSNLEPKKSKRSKVVEKEKPIARFIIEDYKTLVCKSASAPLFADDGARYVYEPEN